MTNTPKENRKFYYEKFYKPANDQLIKDMCCRLCGKKLPGGCFSIFYIPLCKNCIHSLGE